MRRPFFRLQFFVSTIFFSVELPPVIYNYILGIEPLSSMAPETLTAKTLTKKALPELLQTEYSTESDQLWGIGTSLSGNPPSLLIGELERHDILAMHQILAIKMVGFFQKNSFVVGMSIQW